MGYSNNSTLTMMNMTKMELVPHREATIVAVIIIAVFLSAGILGTLWIIFGIMRRPDMRTVIVNIFIISLCINDLLNCFNQCFIITSYVALDWVGGKDLCRFVPEFSMFLAGTAVWHHAFIAIHRYIVVCQNVLYKRMHKEAYKMTVLIVTRVVPFSFVLPAFFIDMSQYEPKLLRCVFSKRYGLRTIVATMVCILIPFLLIISCFSMIFCFIRRSARGSTMNDRTTQHEIQITKMFAVVFSVFFIGFIPYSFVRVGDSDGTLSPDVYVFITVLYAVAAAVNPVLYGTMNQSIRQAVKDAAPCLRAKTPQPESRNGESGNLLSTSSSKTNCVSSSTSTSLINSQSPPHDSASQTHV